MQNSIDNRLRDPRDFSIKPILKDPFLQDFPENTLKIRRNLLMISFFTLIYLMNDLGAINTILGFSFTNGLSRNSLLCIALILNIYLLIHFFWAGWNTIQEWRLKLTGYWNMEDIPTQNIYTNAQHITSHNNFYSYLYLLSSFDNRMLRFLNYIMLSKSGKTPTNEECNNHFSGVNMIHDIQESIKELQNFSEFIRRYNNGFKSYGILASLRMLIIEFGLPVALSLVAISITITQISFTNGSQ